jgi:O-antigen/teichoic acid export membrane protein
LLAGEASQRKAEQAAALVARASRNVVWLMIGASLGLAAIGPWAVPILYGPDFVQSVAPLLILLIAGVLLGFALNLQAYFLSIGRPGVNGLFTLVAGLANLGLSLWLIPMVGTSGNALATLLGSLLSALLHLAWFWRMARVPIRSTFLPDAEDIFMWGHRLRHIVQHAKPLNG